MTTPEHRQPSFHGDGGTLFGILLVNLLLTIVTLGIYGVWGRTKVRRHLWSQTAFDGDRFSYHGTGKELLIGYLKAMAVFFLLNIVISFGAPALGPAGPWVVLIVFWLTVLGLTPLAIVGARRYRLSRTSWRGIRFSLRGRSVTFVGLYLSGLLRSVLTLGFYTPFFHNHVRRFFTDHTYFGTHAFRYDGEGRDLFKPYLVALLLTIPTLGLSWFWYGAARQRYQWSHTSFAGARFTSTMTGGGLLGLALSNLLLIAFTLGIGAAWAIVRQQRYVYDTLALEGAIDAGAIHQDARPGSATAEGISEMLDAGGAFDLGV